METDLQQQSSRQLGYTLIGYGIFLFIIGMVGFLSNPEAAKTALISGTVFGGLSCLFGVFLQRGKTKAAVPAIAMLAFLAIIFSWRSSASWRSVAEGEPKLLAAVLISSMLAATILMLSRMGWILLKWKR